MKRFIKILASSLLISGITLNTVNTFANQNQVVKLSVGNNIASVNGNDTKLNTVPYIQKSSSSMMIPLRFVSTALGIPNENISFNPNTKEIIIKYNDKDAIFQVNSNKVRLGNETKNLTNNSNTITEIVNSSTFIPLRALETAFGFKIEWEANTKTAILSSINKDETTQITTNNINSTDKNKVNIIVTETTTQQQDARTMEEEVVRLVNEERAKNGVQPLTISEDLIRLAREKSKDMYDNSYFDHVSPTLGKPSDVMLQNGIMYSTMGENIAKGQKTPEQVVESWMNSPGHRSNILNPAFNYIGVGFYDYYWTQQFADKLS